MIVCLCEGVSDRVVQQIVDQGHQTVRAVASACGAGTRCGSCVCDLKRLLQGQQNSATPGDPQDPSTPGASR
ncbi:MAG: (2Fe-2S)-binding protein [Deltaproteobacteria bacterium]|nr:MAG: (2Fe-2S)-binding protein [Deltaproteobacteria bacterium]